MVQHPKIKFFKSRKTFLQSLSKIVRAVFAASKKYPFGKKVVMHPLERNVRIYRRKLDELSFLITSFLETGNFSLFK